MQTNEQARAMEVLVEPVAVIGKDWSLLWASPKPLTDIVAATGIAVGSLLYPATALAERDAEVKALVADKDALFDALFDAIAMMGHAMNLSATALIGGEVMVAREVWQKGHDLLLGKPLSNRSTDNG